MKKIIRLLVSINIATALGDSLSRCRFMRTGRGYGWNTVLLVSLAWHLPLRAAEFGIFDARAQGMAGATVAAASVAHAHFYNPALMAFHTRREEESDDGRFYFPVALRVSDSALRTKDIVDENYEDRITAAIDGFNTQRNDESIQGVIDAVESLENDISSIRNQAIELQGFAGLSVTEPSQWQGGAFYVGYRFMGAGFPRVQQEDLDLADAYLDAMRFIASNGAEGAANPELFQNGVLIDPRNIFTSTAEFAALSIIEWGVSAAKSFAIRDHEFAVGVTPKVMFVSAFRDVLSFDGDEFNIRNNTEDHFSMNLDLGFAAMLWDKYRIGFAVKDLIPESFSTTPLSDAVQSPATDEAPQKDLVLRPKSRLGLAYVHDEWTFGVDMDVEKNRSLAGEPKTQDMAWGMEYRANSVAHWRLGYRFDIEGNRAATTSAGLGIKAWKLIGDISLANSQDERALALQLGWAF